MRFSAYRALAFLASMTFMHSAYETTEGWQKVINGVFALGFALLATEQ